MSQSNTQHRRKDQKRHSSSSSSSSSCSSSDEKSKQRRNRKERRNRHGSDKRKGSCSPKRHSKKRSPKCDSPKKRHSRSKSHSKKRSPKCDSLKKHHSPKKCESPKKCDSSSSSSSDSDCDEDKCKIYEYLKRRILTDRSLQAAGSDAHIAVYSQISQTLINSDPIVFQYNQDALNIYHIPNTASVFLRKAGVYSVTWTVTTEEACQFTLFVNGDPVQASTVGKNAGGGQLISRSILQLYMDDVITVRNWNSSQTPIHILEIAGGGQLNANVELVMNKIAPLQNPEDYEPNLPVDAHTYFSGPNSLPYSILDRVNFNTGYNLDEDFRVEIEKFQNYEKSKHYHKHKCLFEEIEEKMLCDPSLNLDQSDCYGVFWRNTPQVIPVEQPILWESSQNVFNMEFTPNTSDVTVKRSGVYRFTFLVGTTKASQFTFFVNGVPETTTTAGTNVAGSQLMLRQILSLNAGDKVSIRNHTSLVGDVPVSNNAGGTLDGVEGMFSLWKMGPLVKNLDCLTLYKPDNKCCPDKDEDDYKCPDYWKYLYESYKRFLKHEQREHEDRLLIAGSDAYASIYSRNSIIIPVETAVVFALNGSLLNMKHITGTSDLRVCKSGIYVIEFDIQTAEPAQFTVFVNGCAIPSTTTGNDSGSAQLSLRQILALKKGDCVTVVNHTSFMGTVTTNQNSGGTEVGVSANLVLWKIAQLPCGDRKHGDHKY